MLGKLIKYEFKATGRIFLPLFAAILFMSGVTKLMVGLQLQAPKIIGMILSIILMAAAFVLVLILTVQRFYKNFLTQEGYLMFTLPTGTGSLIAAKLIVATIWTLVCTAVVYLALMIMAFSGTEWQVLVNSIREIGLPSRDVTLFIIEFAVLTLASILTNILIIYCSIALSMVSDKHRVALSIAFYIALSTVMQLVVTGVLYLFASPVSDTVTRDTVQEFLARDALHIIHTGAVVTTIATIAFGATMFFGTRYMLQKKLNLQ